MYNQCIECGEMFEGPGNHCHWCLSVPSGGTPQNDPLQALESDWQCCVDEIKAHLLINPEMDVIEMYKATGIDGEYIGVMYRQAKEEMNAPA